MPRNVARRSEGPATTFLNQLYTYGLLRKIEQIFKGLLVACKSVKMVIRTEQVVAQGCSWFTK